MQINGNLTLNPNGNSEIDNVIIDRQTMSSGGSAPSIIGSEKGRIIFGTDTNTYYYNNGTFWQSFATGGNASALQTEVDNLEAALGAGINADGTYNATAFSSSPYISTATTVTQALTTLATQIQTDDYLADLLDVSIVSPATNDWLVFNGTKWANHVLVLANVTDVTTTVSELNQLHSAGATNADFIKLHAITATAANINILTGTTVTSTTLNYIDTLSSDAQTQLNNKQPLSTVLTNITSVGAPTVQGDILVGNSDGTFSYQTGAGFRSTQGLVIGTDVQAWSKNLDQFASFVTAVNTTETETINGVTRTTGAVENVILLGSGTGNAGDYWTLVEGAAARDALGLGDIAFLDSAHFIGSGLNGSTSNVAANINWNGFQINNIAPGTTGTDAINLNQLEAAIQGLTWKAAVTAATTANLTALSGTPTIDGIVLSAGERVLVKNQTGNLGNGIYTVASGSWTLVSDFVTGAEATGAAVYIVDGTTQGGTGWTVTGDITLAPGPTTAIAWTQFNGASGLTAGTGLTIVGNTLSVVYGAGITANPTGDVGIDLYSSTGALILTHDGLNASNTVAAGLHLHLDNTTTNPGHSNVTGQLTQSVAGLRVTTNTISEYELTASVAGNGLTGGNGSALALVTAAGTASIGGDTPASWAGVGTLDVTANAVGVLLGGTSTSAAPGNHTHKATAISFVNGTGSSALTGTPITVQDAVVQAAVEINALSSTAGTASTYIDNLIASDGAAVNSTTGAWSGISGTHYLNSATSITNALTTLDTTLETNTTTLVNAVNKMYYLYSGASSTTWNITHSLGQQYVNITIVDSTNNVIIPQSIVMNNANTATVTFNVAVAGKAIIMGLAGGLTIA